MLFLKWENHSISKEQLLIVWKSIISVKTQGNINSQQFIIGIIKELSKEHFMLWKVLHIQLTDWIFARV